MPRIRTRFTERFALEHPIMLAPMDKVAGGRLAAAVATAGGLGLIGGGYGDADWLDAQFAAAGNQAVGVGFITWSLARQPELLETALARQPRALMISFGDGEPFVEQAHAAGVPVIWQVQRRDQARQALAAGADILVVQGQEAGGHGMDRGLVALLPAVRDLAGPDALLVAAGGLSDGRGLAAALMLGADGIMMGTRFWASEEADGAASAKAVLTTATGDDTLRTKVFDLARGAEWPWQYTGRVMRNAFAERWLGDVAGMRAQLEDQQAAYAAADPEDYATRVVIAGEGIDLIHEVLPAARIIERTVDEAAGLLKGAGRFVA